MKIFFLGSREAKERKLINCKSETLPFNLSLINIVVGFVLLSVTMDKALEIGELSATVTSVDEVVLEDGKNNFDKHYYANLSFNVDNENKNIKIPLDRFNYNEIKRVLENDFDVFYNVNYVKNKLTNNYSFDIKKDSLNVKERDVLKSSNTYFETEIDAYEDTYFVIDPSKEEKKENNVNEPHMTDEEFKKRVFEDLVLKNNYRNRNK